MSDSDSVLAGRILIVAFEGWNDAGEAASTVARMIIDQMNLQAVLETDPEIYFDFQFNRPMMAENEGVRTLVWPSITLYGPVDTGSTYVLLGTEPSRNWRSFSDEIVNTILVAGINYVIFLGAMLADAPHTRPISILNSSENGAMRSLFDLERSTYEGPVGILSVLADAAESSGLPTLSIWASVPHYVHHAPSPKAVLAIVDSLERFTEISLDHGNLNDEVTEWEGNINALAADDDDMAAYIAQLETARDTVDSPEASGEAIAREFQRYFNTKDDRDGRER